MPSIVDSLPRPPAGTLKPPPSPVALQFRHRTVGGVSEAADNIMFPWYWTRLDHPALNRNPQAILTVTPVGYIADNAQTAVATLVQNPHPIGVLYRDVDNRWYIYDIGLEAMELNAEFHVAINEESMPD